MEIYTSSPNKSGWYWWKATDASNPIEINVSQKDVDGNKYTRFGGEWHRFPTFDEISNHRSKSLEVDSLIEASNQRVNDYMLMMKKFVDFLLAMTDKTFVPKKDIKAFLEEVRKISLK